MRSLVIALVCLPFCACATAQDLPESFKTGPIVPSFGPAAMVEPDLDLPAGDIKVVFDASEAAGPDGLNPTMVSAARFLNMNGQQGVYPDRLNVAIVVHGNASADLLQTGPEDENPNAALIEELKAANVRIYLCGQTAAARGIDKDELLPGVDVALSAMTAHNILAREGYTLNPF